MQKHVKIFSLNKKERDGLHGHIHNPWMDTVKTQTSPGGEMERKILEGSEIYNMNVCIQWHRDHKN